MHATQDSREQPHGRTDHDVTPRRTQEWVVLLLIVIVVTAVVSHSWSAPVIAAVVFTTIYASPVGRRGGSRPR